MMRGYSWIIKGSSHQCIGIVDSSVLGYIRIVRDAGSKKSLFKHVTMLRIVDA